MMSLLRYNARYNLYYHPTYVSRGGARIILGWSLNPIGSTYDGRQRTLSEPLWLFRLRQRWFAFAGRQRCGRRDDMFAMNCGDGHLPDTWDRGPDGCRTCSYCGSLHPDDFMRICRLAAEDERYSVEPSDKRYKVYVKQPDVRNAGEGGIKFYMQHVVGTPSDEDQATYKTAVRVSRERFNAKIQANRPPRSASA